MALPVKYDPFYDIRKMQREMDELFESFFDRESGRSVLEWGSKIPIADIEDIGNAIKITVELPGVEKEDIKIEVNKESVEISAEREKNKEKKQENYVQCERSYSSFRRIFRLPEEINTEKTEASYEKGLLTITMEKTYPKYEKKEIKVN